MPNISFNVSVYVENEAVLPELEARMQDLSPAFEAIFNEWTQLNVQKFEQSVGMEASGADIFGEPWTALTHGYMKEKHSEGKTRVTKKMARGKSPARFESSFPDWLMVRTGALREALTNPEAMFKDIEPLEAYFGTPNDSDLADIVRWNYRKRPTVFLSGPDLNAIRRILQDYFSLGGDFAEIRSAKAMEKINLEKEIGSMDAEFEASV